ncbi:MAG: F0F1 ATP synthase subunit delta [Elusimicrobia bacterium]|nr:F0F1 ATP synthase subunit delta [Elusimicrobiota bacterium]
MRGSDKILASRYARAFMPESSSNLAQAQNLYAELIQLKEKISAVADYLKNPVLPLKLKLEIVDEKFKPCRAVGLLRLLLSAKRFYLLDEIVSQAQNILDKFSNTARASVATAEELDAVLREKITASIKQITSKNISAGFSQNPALLGGFRAEADGVLIDASVKRRAEILRREMYDKA